MSEEWRVGPGYRWKDEKASGYAVDNLDTKQVSELTENPLMKMIQILRNV